MIGIGSCQWITLNSWLFSYETEKNGANGSPATGMTSQAVDDVLSDSHSKDPKSSCNVFS